MHYAFYIRCQINDYMIARNSQLLYYYYIYIIILFLSFNQSKFPNSAAGSCHNDWHGQYNELKCLQYNIIHIQLECWFQKVGTMVKILDSCNPMWNAQGDELWEVCGCHFCFAFTIETKQHQQNNQNSMLKLIYNSIGKLPNLSPMSYLQSLCQVVSNYSRKIRLAYTAFGLTGSEINQAFARLIVIDSTDAHNGGVALVNDSQFPGKHQCEAITSQATVADLVRRQLNQHNHDISDYFYSLIGKLEIELASLQKYENLGEEDGENAPLGSQSLVAQNENNVSSQEVEQGGRLDGLQTIIKKSKKSRSESTNNSSEEDVQLSSFQALIRKTRLLKDMLERQMITETMMHIKNRDGCRIGRFNRYLVQ